MNRLIHTLFVGATSALLGLATASGVGFTESDVVFYGEVRQSGGGQTILLQSGALKVTFVNQSNAANRVTLETSLRPTGVGQTKPFSYALDVPLAYLPETARLDEFLSIGATSTNFKIQEITINGVPATLPDGSKEFYGLNFASRSSEYRLDLLVAGGSTDSDGDGLPDWWEGLYGLDPDLADANIDFDGDGWSDLEEFRRGSNPAVSNRDPLLVTSQIIVPESGEAGVYLHVLDSDTPDSGIMVTLAGSAAGSGFELKLDGVALSPGATRQLPLSQLKSGRLSIRQLDRAVRSLALPVSWNDGGEEAAGQVLVNASVPSTEDGTMTTLWLDGLNLPAEGQGIATWSDRSGHARHAMQPLAGHQPRVTGRSADFSASASAHLFFQDSAMPSGNHTVLASYSAAASSAAPQMLLSTNRGYIQLAPTSQAVSYPGAPVYQMDTLAVRGHEKAAGSTATSIFRRDGNLLQNVFAHSYDGANIPTEEIEPVLPTLGARRSAIPSGDDPVDEAFHGQLHELLVFPSALPEQQLRDVSDYLESKWAGAVIWDFSTGLRDFVLSSSSGAQRRIIRGGFGADKLGGGPLDDTISGGGGDDILAGGSGGDRFVFGGVDTGRDRITDYDQTTDIIDLSAMFWGMSGDARQSISVRLDANYSTPVPTLESVLVVLRPNGGGTQEIVLENTVISSTQLIRLIVEGRICMGGLSIPTALQLAAGSSAVPLHESLDQPFAVTLNRSGAGVPAKLDVPLGFFADALGGDFVVEGDATTEGLRSVVHFARGQTSKTVTVRPLPDLETEGVETWQVGVLPHFRYTVAGTQVERLVSDYPMIHSEILEANALVSNNQAARVRIHRDGSVAQSLVVDLQWGGTAVEGSAIQTVPHTITIPAGQDFADVSVSARSQGLTAGPKVVLLRLASRDRYLLGNPHEAVLYAATTAAAANGAGFDRWLQATSHGTITSFADLVATAPETVDAQLQAYAFGLNAAQDPHMRGISLRIVNDRPEISVPGTLNAADLRWTVEAGTGGLDSWADVGSSFVATPNAGGLKLVGPPLNLASSHGKNFYRLNLTLDPGQPAASSIRALTSATRFGISGSATWTTDQATGNLITLGGSAGETNRVIAETDGPASLDFEMAISGAGAGDLITFYIDGVKKAETTGPAVRVQAEVTAPGTRLMWEFKRGSGQAVIRKLAP